MNEVCAKLVFAMVLTGLGASFVQAAESSKATLLACAAEPDDARRLRCFDDAAAALRGAPEAASAEAAGAPAVASRPTSAPAASAEDRFGAREKLEREEPLREIVAVVAAVSAKPHGELVITLENGQVWAELATGSKVKVKPGDTVNIKAGTLGSFFLIAPNRRSTKVSRIQ